MIGRALEGVNPFGATLSGRRDCCVRYRPTHSPQFNVLMDIERMKTSQKVPHGSATAVGSAAQSNLAISAVALVDEHGRIVDITADAAAMLGYEPEGLRGRALTELAAPAGRP